MKGMLGVAALLLAAGCSSQSSGGPASTPDASTDATSASFGTSACGSCVATACASAITACNGVPDCAAYLSCLDGCPVGAGGGVSASCQSGCAPATSSAGQQAQGQLTACMTSGAGASCSACGGVSDAGAEGGILHESCPPDPDAANPCNACIHEQCCDPRLTCLNDPSCLALLDCESDCLSGLPDDGGATATPPDGGPYSCDQWCNAKNDPALGEWAQLMACSQVLCDNASACGGADTCTTCNDTSCASEYFALVSTPDGYLWGDCIAQCATTDTACNSGCGTAYPSISAQISAWGTCIQQHCPSCANGIHVHPRR